MKLSDAFSQPLGRAAFLSLDAETQLLGAGEALASQFARLLRTLPAEIQALLGVKASAPAPARLPWTLLTEPEHSGWSLLALSDPPALTGGAAARLAAHLATAPQVMPAAQRRRWVTPHAHVPEPTWGVLLAEVATAQAVPALLGHWGVLSACVGLNQQHRPRAAALLEADLQRGGEALLNPPALAEAAVWAALWPLHGGLLRPDRAGVARLAQSLRTPRPQPQPLPAEAPLRAWLGEHLPDLPPEVREQLAAQLHGGPGPAGADPTSGICLSEQPGAVAYWLRRRREVQLIACTGPDAEVHNRVWTVLDD